MVTKRRPLPAAGVSCHLELPEMRADASQAGVGLRVIFRAGLNREEVGPRADTKMAESATFLEKGRHLRRVVLFDSVLGHREARLCRGLDLESVRTSNPTQAPAKTVRLDAVPVLDKANDAYLEFVQVLEVA